MWSEREALALATQKAHRACVS